MASNPLPDQIDQLLTLAEDMADGLAAHEVAIGIKQNLEADVRMARSVATSNESNYQAKRSVKTAKTAAQTVADSNGRAFIAASKRVLEHYLGRQWSAAWAEAGFVNNSTAIPKTIEERMNCLQMLETYFTAHPAHTNAGLGVTAAAAGALFTALSDARSEVHDAINDAAAAKATRDQTVQALRIRMRGLIDELDQLLEDDDARWYAFGLNRPSDPQTPDVPEDLILAAGPAGTVIADWGNARRAERYRVFKQIVGTDADFVFNQTVTESDATLSSLPSGETLKVRVTAANDAGESAPSVEQEIVVP
jgi:hypothetical protein